MLHLIFNLNWFNLKIEGNERNDKALKVLSKIVQHAKTFGVLATLDLTEQLDLRS